LNHLKKIGTTDRRGKEGAQEGGKRAQASGGS